MKTKNENNLRLIKTGRDIESINIAALEGFYPLIKKLEPSLLIRSKYAIMQHTVTGKIDIINDFRTLIRGIEKYDNDYKNVIDFTFYYPYQFPSPFAAYLVPSDIQIGERVFLEDLIEDYIGATWNQGDTYRLESCEAIWDGKDFEIQYDPKINRDDFIG